MVGYPPKTVLGHEAIGQIVEVGSLVKNFKIGDKVIVPAMTPDWNTTESETGMHQHEGRLFGGGKFTSKKPGVFAEFFNVNNADANLCLLPEGMDPGVAVMMTDMITTGLHGCELADVHIADTVCVIGIGPVGLMAIACANIMGASRIIAVGTRQKCVELAKEYGATDVISYKDGPVFKQVLALTGGKGVDRCIVAGGDVDSMIDATYMVRPGGSIGNVNFFSSRKDITIPLFGWGMGMAHKNINGGMCPGGKYRMEQILRLIQCGKLDPSKMITHKFYGLDKLDDAFMIMHEKPADLIKPVVYIDYND